MSRNSNQKKLAAPVKPRAHEALSQEARTDESAIRQVDPRIGARTLRSGFPLVGSEVLEAVGANGVVGRAMHDVIHTPDDERMATRLGPEQGARVAFRPDEGLGDAGAEFAAEFGRDFVMAATTGEDFGEIYNASSTETSEAGGGFLQDMGMSIEMDDVTEFAEPVDDEEPPKR
jgi:hypothetical protein